MNPHSINSNWVPRTRKGIVRALGVSAAIAFVGGNLVVGLFAGGRPSSLVPATDAEIEAFLVDQVRDAGYPGAAFAVIRDGRVTHAGGIGSIAPGGSPVSEDTPFVIGSLSKSFTATAVMQLVEAGRAVLDAPVTDYVTDFAVADDRADAITVRHLLTQTSGIPSSAGITPLASDVSTLEAQVRALAGVSLASEPGTAFAYSNANYWVLGLLVERVSGQSFGAFVADHIFAPLGFRHSHTDLAAAQADGLTRAHRFWFGLPDSGAPLWRPDFQPAGWLISSAGDLGRFAAANLNGGILDDSRILSATSVEEMHRGAAAAIRGSYGMGWIDGAVGGVRTVSHSGSTTDMASAMYLVPERGLGFVVLFNGQSVLYELLHKPEAIAEAAVARMVGVPAGGTLSALYPIFTVVMAILLALQLRGLWRAIGAVRRGQPTVRPFLGRRTVGIAFAAWGRVILPLIVLWTTPETLGAPWSILVQIDLGQVLAAYVVLQLATAAVAGAPLVGRLMPVGRARRPARAALA